MPRARMTRPGLLASLVVFVGAHLPLHIHDAQDHDAHDHSAHDALGRANGTGAAPGPRGHTCIQDSLWKAGEVPRIVPQDTSHGGDPQEPRRRAAEPQSMRIGLDFSFLTPSNAQASEYTCFVEGEYYVRGSVFVSPVRE